MAETSSLRRRETTGSAALMSMLALESELTILQRFVFALDHPRESVRKQNVLMLAGWLYHKLPVRPDRQERHRALITEYGPSTYKSGMAYELFFEASGLLAAFLPHKELLVDFREMPARVDRNIIDRCGSRRNDRILVDDDPSIVAVAMRQETIENKIIKRFTVDELLRSLTPTERKSIELKAEGLTDREIAGRMNISPTAATDAVKRARKKARGNQI